MAFGSDISGTITLAPVDGDIHDAPLSQLCVSVFSFAFQLRQVAESYAGYSGGGPRDGVPVESGGTSAHGLIDDLDDDMPGGAARPATPVPQQPAGQGGDVLAGVLKRAGTRMLRPQQAPAGGEETLPIFARDEAHLRAVIDELFAELDDLARKANRPQESVRMCKYALAAYLDEVILSSLLPVKEPWLGRPLQLEYFNDFSAGEEFYNKLDNLRDGLRHTPDEAKREVLEVYYLCLSFGFCGKYGDSEGREKRKVLIDKLARELDETEAHKEALSPHGLPRDEPRVQKRRWPLWVVPVASAAGVVIVYVVLRVLLDDATQSLLTITS